MMRLAPYLPRAGTLASAMLIVLAVPMVEWSWLIWIGLVPWLFTLRRCTTSWQAVGQSFWLNLLLGFGGAFWVAGTAERYLSVSTSAALLVLLAHALVHQLQLVAFGAIYWKASRAASPTTFRALLGLAFLYTGLDWITPKLFHDTLGMVLYSSATLRQLAAFGGTALLTFVVVIVNLASYAMAAELAQARQSQERAAKRLGGAVFRLALPIVVFAGIGAYEGARTERALREPARVLRVGIVQGSVSADVRRRWAQGDPEAAKQSLEAYVRSTQELLGSPEPPELVVWPETAFPGVFRKPESDPQLLLNVAFDRFVAASGVPFAFGAYDREDREDRRVLRNALYLVTPLQGQPNDRLSPMQVYHKSVLFPVGEYVPFFDEHTIRRWLPGSAQLAAGEGPELLDLERPDGVPVRLGPSICYEDVFASHTRTLARLGADLVLNISNDSWFGDYGAARWHLMMATLRSVETRLPQVRATNSGYSAFILPDGQLHEATEFGERAARVFTIPIVDLGPTLNRRLGDWYGPLSLVLGAVWLLSGWLRRRDSPY